MRRPIPHEAAAIPQQWYEVHAAFAVLARDGQEDTAINAIANAIRGREHGGPAGVFPVGDFAAAKIVGEFPAPGRGPSLGRRKLLPILSTLRELVAYIEGWRQRAASSASERE